MSKHYERYEDLKEAMIQVAVNGEVEATYKELGQLSSIGNQSSVKNYIDKMVSEGFLKRLNTARKGVKGTKYLVVGKNNPTISIEDELKDTVELEFMGVTLVLKRTSLGLAISTEQLAMATLTDLTILDKIIASNSDLFFQTMTVVDGEKFLNKNGVIHYLLKLNTSNSLPIKQSILADFQNKVVEKLCDAHMIGKIILTEEEKAVFKHNLHCLTDLKREDIQSLFENIESQVNNIIEVFQHKVHDVAEEKVQVEKKLNRTNSLLESEKHKRQICMTQKIELENRLMDRQN